MAMTKKNYEHMVKLIVQQGMSRDEVARLVRLMADFFQADNPKFDREKFMEACGVI